MSEQGPPPSDEMQFLARPDCGPCLGDPSKKPCPEEFEKEHLDLPALVHADKLCVMALYHMLKRTPVRMKRAQTRHSWNLIDAAMGVSQQKLYGADTKEFFDLSFQIADNVRERPYEGAYEQIQSRTILAYEPLLRAKYLNPETGISDADRHETCTRIGHVIETIQERFHEYYNYDEAGIAENLSAQLEIAYLGIRAGLDVWPASVRQEKSPVQKENYDLYADHASFVVPVQVINHKDKRSFNPKILELNYPLFRRDIMSMNNLKERDYARTIRSIIILESKGEAVSPAKTKRLDRGSARLQRLVATHAEKNI